MLGQKCWFCETNLASPKSTRKVKLYKADRRRKGATTYTTTYKQEIYIPECEDCRKLRNRVIRTRLIQLVPTAIISVLAVLIGIQIFHLTNQAVCPIVIGLALWIGLFYLMRLLYTRYEDWWITKQQIDKDKIEASTKDWKEYPPLAKLLDQGWALSTWTME